MNNTIMDWYGEVMGYRLDEFEQTGYVRPQFHALYATNTQEFKRSVVMNVPEGLDGYRLLHGYNFRSGYPITACSFACMVTLPVGEKQQEALFMTLETPLRIARQIFLIMDIEGKPRPVLDYYLSQFGTVNPDIHRFNKIITNLYSTE